MDANQSRRSTSRSRAHETVPLLAEEGMLLLDLGYQVLACDRGASAILVDINRYSGNPESGSAVPAALTAALREQEPHELSGVAISLNGERQIYRCRAFLIESRLKPPKPPSIMVHLQKARSTGDAIRKLAVDCGLTPREEEVLSGVAAGLTSKELANRLQISPNTVKSFVHLIMIKLGVTTRSAIVGKLLTNGNQEASHGAPG